MINFMKYKLFYFIFSGVFLLPGIFFLLRFGLKPSLDFTGGTLLELTVSTDLDSLRSAIEQELSVNSLQQSNSNQYILRTGVINQQQNTDLQAKLAAEFGDVQERRFETIGPTLGKELIRKTLVGILLVTAFILYYIAIRFKSLKYGICAVLAMLHDSLILLGAFSFLGVYFGVEIDAMFVTAMLTILSFSVHDTIVVYDRIRETRKFNPQLPLVTIVNQAVTKTLGRSINNSLTIIFMLLSLYLLGGETTKWFIFALLIGTISGTYSSTFTAAPLLVLWEEVKSRQINQGDNHAR